MIELIRVAILPAGAFGVLTWAGLPFAVTIERTYGLTVKIAPAKYKLTRTHYNRGGYDVWQVVGGDITADRRILIHKGNVANDVDGCIAVGEQFEPLNNIPAILQSGKAFQELMTLSSEYDALDFLVTQ